MRRFQKHNRPVLYTDFTLERGPSHLHYSQPPARPIFHLMVETERLRGLPPVSRSLAKAGEEARLLSPN